MPPRSERRTTDPEETAETAVADVPTTPAEEVSAPPVPAEADVTAGGANVGGETETAHDAAVASWLRNNPDAE